MKTPAHRAHFCDFSHHCEQKPDKRCKGGEVYSGSQLEGLLARATLSAVAKAHGSFFTERAQAGARVGCNLHRHHVPETPHLPEKGHQLRIKYSNT